MKPRIQREYEPIWLSIKSAKFGTEVPVRIHASQQKRLVQAVRKEKTADVAIRRKVGMPTEGPLVMRVTACPKDPAFVIIYFKIAFNEKLI